MGVQDLQVMLEASTIPGSCVGVDLIRIARTISSRMAKQQQKKGINSIGKFSLVVDGECCLDRLYGGYFSDWACGGQWNRMVSFLAQFISSLQKANIDLVVFFNGCNEQARMAEWVAQQHKVRGRVSMVLKHIATKGTPPPKVWWTPPVCLRAAIRMVLRHLNVSVVCTMDDHRQEVIAYCRENGCHGLIADDAEYAAFDPPRYFSARQLKLTYKGSLESKEYIMSELMKGLDLTSDKLCVVAALLGNYLLSETDLADLYKRLGITPKFSGEQVIKALANLVKTLPSTDDLDIVASTILGSSTDTRLARLKQSIQYYLDGTKDGFLNYRHATTTGKRGLSGKASKSGGEGKTTSSAGNRSGASELESVFEPDLDTTKLASETEESELLSLHKYKEATACLTVSGTTGPEIVIEESSEKAAPIELAAPVELATPVANGSAHTLLISSSSSSSSSSATSPARVTSEAAKKAGKKSKAAAVEEKSRASASLPVVAPEVMRTVSERHNKGLMSPAIYQILTQGELKLPVVMEDETHKEMPSVHHFYRPVRQMVYAILFNVHHHLYMAARNKDSKEGTAATKVAEVKVREWVWSRANPYAKAESVRAEQIGWGVPTIQRLWFGTAVDDKRRRLRAYLTCMRSDTQLILNPDYVPQHLLIMATVLRYMMSFPDKKILRRPELDAFITQALSPELMNADYSQELQLAVVSSRGGQLATMFMQGVETALMVNDACGAPIPWLMCCPWLFFDGKLFHHLVARAAVVQNLLELCDHRIGVVMKVERMRQAVLEGLSVQFARPPIPVPLHQPASPYAQGTRSVAPNNMLPSGVVSAPTLHRLGLVRPGMSPRGLSRRPIPPNSGGRLEIAGVVVGSWGPNYNLAPVGMGRAGMVQPQVTSVGGGMNNYGGNVFRGQRPSFSTRGGATIKGKGRGFRGQQSGGKKRIISTPGKKEPKKTLKGRGMTVSLDAGDTVLASDLLGEEKKKKILTNKDQSEIKLAGLGRGITIGESDLVNGAGGDTKANFVAIGQFDDAASKPFGGGGDGMAFGINGESEGPMGVKAILAAAKAEN